MDNITVDTPRNNKLWLGTPCIVCGETVLLTEDEEMFVYGGCKIQSKMCDKCKKAVLFIREQLDRTTEILD